MKRYRVAAAWIAALVLLIVLIRRLGPTPGDLYSVEGDNGYKVAKILAVDSDAVHIRLYKNTFAKRPSDVDPGKLSLGSIYDPEGFGMAHMPLSRSTFSRWNPKFIRRGTVSDEELEGYKQWKQHKGALF